MSEQERPTGPAGAAGAPGPAGTAGPAGSAGVAGSTGTSSTTRTAGSGAPGQRGAHRSTGYEEGYGEPAGYEAGDGRTVAAMGFTVLAAVLMMLTGLVDFFVGITGIIRGSFFTTVPNYAFYFSARGRGWVDLVLGAVIFAAGVCLLLGMVWARIVGIVLAVLVAIANFMFLPYYPIWSIIVIALSVFIIWALATDGSRRRMA